MNNKKKKIEKLLLTTLEEDSSRVGTPLVVVMNRLIKGMVESGLGCDEVLADETIKHALDSWIIDKTIASVPEKSEIELGLPLGLPAWHLKLLTPEETDWHRSLSSLDRAIIQLLREQNNPQTLGSIPTEIGRKALIDAGFADVDKYPFVVDKVRSFMCNVDGENKWWFGLIEEHEKTEEYKQWSEERLQRHLEKEVRYQRMLEDLEESENEEDA